MIIIAGNQGEGSGFLTNIAVENLLVSKPKAVVILLDDTGEFIPLCEKSKGTLINIGTEHIPLENRSIDDNNFYVVQCDFPIYNLIEVKKLEKMFPSKWVFVIYKTTDLEQASFIKNEYEKLGLRN